MSSLASQIRDIVGDRHCVIVTDSNCHRLVVKPLALPWPVIEFEAGEANKNLTTLAAVWEKMIEAGCTRRSVVVNIGGGVVTDLGGFAAATFKRGIPFVNVPTTLLAAVDAAVGGKTGIDFMGLKNEIGAFREAEAVVVDTAPFATLPQCQLLSGYAEMVKHGLLMSRRDFRTLIARPVIDHEFCCSEEFKTLLNESINCKSRVVEADPTEKGLRRYLNLGHTAGHAIETLVLQKGHPVPHGYAVAWGLVVALVLSHLRLGFPSEDLHMLAAFVRDNYGSVPVGCNDYPRLLELMAHDKKNPDASTIAFTLLAEPGLPDFTPDICATLTPALAVSRDDIATALDIARDLC